VAAVPRGACSWGTARKVLNIFLRNAFYTTYLRERYALSTAEALFEVPLDSITGKWLIANARQKEVPQWSGVRHLTTAASESYQQCATRLARQMGIERVHLDVYAWGNRMVKPAESRKNR
jgi:hypothetical protein